MKPNILIDSIVRQVTVLLADLSTSLGIRAPVAHIANDMFLHLAREFEAQGVSRKVSADMFGMALRAYVRKVRRLSEGGTDPGVTLSQAVLDFVRREGLVSRTRLRQRFRHDDERSVVSVLRDHCDGGLIFSSGSGESAAYRAATDEELGELSKLASDEGLQEMAWVLVHREGPLSSAELAARMGRSESDLATPLDRLKAEGRVSLRADGTLLSTDFVIPLGSEVGWEAGVFDHFQAVVQTIRQRLELRGPSSTVGGSTYSFDLPGGHPLRDEVEGQLSEIRGRLGELRQRVDDFNRTRGLGSRYDQIVVYAGQYRARVESDSFLPEDVAPDAEEPNGGDDHPPVPSQ